MFKYLSGKLNKIFSIIFVSAALTLSSCSVAANENQNKEFTCNLFSTLASAIMEVRQNAVPMSTVLKNNKKDKNFSSILDNMTIEAYKRPLYSSEKHKQIAIDEFSSEYHLNCLIYFEKKTV